MKLGTKMFFCITIFFSIAFLFGGYLLISYFYDITMEREIEAAVEQHQYNKFVVQANLITRGEESLNKAAAGDYDINSIASDMSGMTALFAMDGRKLFSGFSSGPEIEELLHNVVENQVSYRFLTIGDRNYLLTAGNVSHGSEGVYLVTGTDVTRVSGQQEQMIEKFGAVYVVTMGIGSVLIFALSTFLTKPVKILTEAVKKIADGNYSERVAQHGADEVGQLARDFNRMAAAVEEKVQELSDSARQKEDFVANFAHELKTPLTSIIGYADRIYHKEMLQEERKRAAWYIWNEGMRLESLSHKLMDMTVLNHKDFVLQETDTEVLFQELAADVEYMLKAKGISLDCNVQRAYIAVEYDLFKTLFLNLADNAVKAGATQIQVTGTQCGSEYVIQLSDNGSGIPAQEIKRITEAFYMVDKSRSRKQHGAGIGLALAEKIAQIHGSTLEFESDGASWTKVSLRMKCKGAENDEQE
ncbi:MAG: HAMP domain-containing histidine kinase [Lachnospiraceae bacterium]|nr:HAMP domain-containing histidine kinase [Lachnospiraceae bacterium]